MKCRVTFFKAKDGSTRWTCGRFFLGTGTSHALETETCYSSSCAGRFLPERVCASDDCSEILINPLNPEIYCDTHIPCDNAPCRESAKIRSTQGRYCSKKCKRFHTIKDLQYLKCATDGCKRDVAPHKLRHCSEQCRLRANRMRYKNKKKAQCSTVD